MLRSRRRPLRTPLLLLALAAMLTAATPDTARGGTPRTVAATGYVVTRDGAQLHYEIVGAGEPVIVVSGGFLLRDALAPLADGRRVVFFDARGRGRSDAVPRERVSLDHQVDDIEDLRLALALERFVLLGWSGMGKETAIYTLRHPERVERLLQVAPVPPVAGDFMQRMMAGRLARIDRAASDRLDAEFDARRWDADPQGFCRARAAVDGPATFADPAHAAAIPDTCRWPNEWPHRLWRHFGALLPSVEAADPTAALGGLAVPRLVIHGADDDIPLDGTRLWVDGQPNACLLVLPNAGHWPFVEAAPPFFAAVDEFLAGRWPAGATGDACVSPGA